MSVVEGLHYLTSNTENISVRDPLIRVAVCQWLANGVTVLVTSNRLLCIKPS